MLRTTRRPSCRLPAAAAVGLALAGCFGKAPSSGGDRGAGASTLPESLALSSEPAGAKSVKEVVAAARSGDEVIASGRVGVEGTDLAYFTLVDSSLKSCTDIGDECKTPWDFCCTPPDEMAKLSATVQFRDGDKSWPTSVLGFQGLDHLSTVVVRGRAEKDPQGNLTIVATGVFVKR
jgi:hypothetical protein